MGNYKIRKQKPINKEKILESIQDQISKQESYLTQKIKNSHLDGYLQTETVLFECGKKNFFRLKERFKHDDEKLTQIIKDWFNYMETVSDIISESELLDLAKPNEDADEHRIAQDRLAVTIQEIDTRFKNLLGSEYVDWKELI